jgi:hypothetical protein
LWQLAASLTLYYGSRPILEIPTGFIADGNSWHHKHAASEPAGWVHDWMYRDHSPGDYHNRPPHPNGSRHLYTRGDADYIFYQILVDSGVRPTYAGLQWLGARAMGWRYWRKLPPNVAKET